MIFSLGTTDLSWGNLMLAGNREPLESRLTNLSYTDFLWELNQMKGAPSAASYTAGKNGGGFGNYYVGLITSVPYVRDGKKGALKGSHNQGADNESIAMKGPWYVSYSGLDTMYRTTGKGKYDFHPDGDGNTYYADRIVLRQEMDYALDKNYVNKYQLGTYYTGVGLWWDSWNTVKGGARNYVEANKEVPDGTYFTTSTYSEIFNDYTYNRATGNYAHAEGYHTYVVSSTCAHGEGKTTVITSSENAHAEGLSTVIDNAHEAHVEGTSTKAYNSAYSSHAEGTGSYVKGVNAHAENSAYANGLNSHAGGEATAGGNWSFAHGKKGTLASGTYSVTLVSGTASGENSVAISGGQATTKNSIAIGVSANANTSEGAVALGKGTSTGADSFSTNAGKANGTRSVAMNNATAIGVDSLAEGNNTYANGNYSHSEGNNTYANGIGSHTEGNNTYANGNYAHAEGYKTKTTNEYEHAQGRFNQSYTGSDTQSASLFEIGDGIADDTRHNIVSIFRNGDFLVDSNNNTYLNAINDLSIRGGQTLNLNTNKLHLHADSTDSNDGYVCVRADANTYLKGSTTTYIGKDQEENLTSSTYIVGRKKIEYITGNTTETFKKGKITTVYEGNSLTVYGLESEKYNNGGQAAYVYGGCYMYVKNNIGTYIGTGGSTIRIDGKNTISIGGGNTTTITGANTTTITGGNTTTIKKGGNTTTIEEGGNTTTITGANTTTITGGNTTTIKKGGNTTTIEEGGNTTTITGANTTTITGGNTTTITGANTTTITGGNTTTIGKENTNIINTTTIYGTDNLTVTKSKTDKITGNYRIEDTGTYVVSPHVTIGQSNNKSTGNYSTTIGNNNNVTSQYGVAIGDGNTNNGISSILLGTRLMSSTPSKVSVGKYNKSYTEGIFEVGMGNDNDHRKNAFTTYGTGVTYFHYQPYVYDSYINGITYDGVNTFYNKDTRPYKSDLYPDQSVAVSMSYYNLSYKGLYDTVIRKFSAIGSIPCVKSIDSISRTTTTNTLHYTKHNFNTNGNNYYSNTYTITQGSASEDLAGLMSAQDKTRLDQIWGGDKTIALMNFNVSSCKWTIYKNDGTTSYTAVVGMSSSNTTTSQSLCLEYGFKVKWTGSWKWISGSDYKNAERCTGSISGTTLPSANTYSPVFTSTLYNSSSTSPTSILSQTIYAKKRGLIIDGYPDDYGASNNGTKHSGRIRPASGEDDTRSLSVALSHYYLFFYGEMNTIPLNMNIIKRLSVMNCTSKNVTCQYKTSKSENYFVFAYPDSFGNMSAIKKNGVDIITTSFLYVGTFEYVNGAGVSIKYKVYRTGAGIANMSITIS